MVLSFKERMQKNTYIHYVKSQQSYILYTYTRNHSGRKHTKLRASLAFRKRNAIGQRTGDFKGRILL